MYIHFHFLQYLPPTAINTTIRLHELRVIMRTHSISAYIIPGTDAHLVAKFLSSIFSHLFPSAFFLLLFPSYLITSHCSLIFHNNQFIKCVCLGCFFARVSTLPSEMPGWPGCLVSLVLQVCSCADSIAITLCSTFI